MRIEDAQRDTRQTFLGGFVGQLVSAVLWLASAALSTWTGPRQGLLFLVVAGFFIFPLTVAGLKVMGRPAGLPRGHPFNALGMQVALTLPLTMPVLGVVALYRLEWFYPAFMVLLGAHYLPFVFLYGMRMFAVLSGLLVMGGVGLALYGPPVMALGGWFTGAALMIFAFLGRALVVREAAGG